nr:reverse transcriptase [Zea mays]
ATDTAFSIYGVECGTIHTYTAALTRPAALHKPLVVAHAKCSTPGHNRVCAETQRQGPRQARRRVHVRRLHFTGLQLHVRRQHGRRRQHVVHVQRVLPGAELDGRGLRLPWGGHGITPPERWLSRAGAYNAAAPNEVDVLRWTLKGVLWPRVTYCIAGWIDLGDGVAEGADHAVRVRFRVDDGCVVEGGTVCAESGSWTEIKGVFRLKRNARVMEVYVQGAVAGIDVKVTDPQVFATNVIQNLAYVDFFTKHFDWAVEEKEFRWYHVEDAAKVFDKMLTGEEAPSVQRGVDAYVVLEEMQNNGPFPDVFT